MRVRVLAVSGREKGRRQPGLANLGGVAAQLQVSESHGRMRC
jgi:hypothetical protein